MTEPVVYNLVANAWTKVADAVNCVTLRKGKTQYMYHWTYRVAGAVFSFTTDEQDEMVDGMIIHDGSPIDIYVKCINNAGRIRVDVHADAAAAAVNVGGGYINSAEIEPLNEKQYKRLIDVDDVDYTVATHYFPSVNGVSMDGLKDMSITGKLLDADHVMTLSAEVINDEDVAADWISAHFYDDHNGATIDSIANVVGVDGGLKELALSLNEANFDRIRFKLVVLGATNTVVLKSKQKAI